MEFLKVFFLLLLYASLASILSVFPYATVTLIFFDFLPSLIAALPLLPIFGPVFSLPSIFVGAGICVLLDKHNKANALNLSLAGAIIASIGNTVIFEWWFPVTMQLEPSRPILFAMAGAMTGYFLWRWYYRGQREVERKTL